MTPHVVATPRNRSPRSRSTPHRDARCARVAEKAPKDFRGGPDSQGDLR
jgi:hypothetical protein